MAIAGPAILKSSDPPDADERRKLERKMQRLMLTYWNDEVLPAVLREAQIQTATRTVGAVFRDFGRKMNQIVLPVLERGVQNGVENAAAELEELGIGIDFSLVNEGVLKWARSHGSELVKGITKTSRNQTRQAISNWIASGDPLPVLEDKLAVTFGKKRAELIASTEVTRVYAEGNMRAWQESGVVEAKVWRTVRDERVCPICEPFDNMVVGFKRKFTHPDDKIAKQIGKVMAPPAHPRCRCWISPRVVGSA